MSLGLALLASVLVRAQEVPAFDLKAAREEAAKAGAVAGAPPAPPASVSIKTSPAAPPPAEPEMVCGNDDFKPEDGACPPEDPDFPGKRAGLTRAQIVKGRMELSWGEIEDGGRVLVFLAPFEIPFEVRQRLGVSVAYAKGSCPYRVTFEHERVHWQDNLKLYEESLAALRAELGAMSLPTEKEPKAFGKGRAAEIEAYQDSLGRELARVVGGRRSAFKAAALDKVRERDGADEYDRVYRKCKASDWKARGL